MVLREKTSVGLEKSLRKEGKVFTFGGSNSGSLKNGIMVHGVP